MQGFQLIMNFLVLPIFFLSDALYPFEPPPQSAHPHYAIDPLSYGVDGLRGMLIGVWHFNFALDVALLGALTAVFLASGAYLFSRIQL